MITLVTGVPGAGKTLYAVSRILDNLKSDNPRPIFSNINGLDYDALKCFPLSEAQIFDLSQFTGMSAVVIIDECQRFYPPRPSGSKVPEYISYFNVHRHDGIDVILITQGPKLIDKQLRDVVGEHIHFTRPFNMSKNFMYRWTGCNDDPEPSKSETNAVRTSQALNKDVFKYYKSTVENTHTSRFPRKKIYIFVGLILMSVLLFSSVVFYLLNQKSSVNKNSAVSSAADPSAAAPGQNLQAIGNKQSQFSNTPVTSASATNLGFPNVTKPLSNSYENTITNNDIDNISELNNEISIVGFISGTKNIPVLSKGYKITDFSSYYFDAFNNQIFLCFSRQCSPMRYDFIIKSSKYMSDMTKYVSLTEHFRRR